MAAWEGLYAPFWALKMEEGATHQRKPAATKEEKRTDLILPLEPPEQHNPLRPQF